MKYLIVVGYLAIFTSLAQAADNPPGAVAAANASSGDILSGFSGKVVETMNAAQYTYVLVDTGPKKVWAAAPAFPVKVGDTVAIAEGMPMQKYHSKTLKRDFDVVYFTGAVTVNGVKPAGSGGASEGMAELPKGHPPIDGLGTGKQVDFTGIKKPAGGKTVSEVWANKSKLKGQSVQLRGKVVKYNPNIMGKNWVHVQDGSGEAGSNDLLVTTATDVKVGDTVLVTGVVATDKDFGANYKYAVMVEDAKVKVE
jgi:hypothetical protein